MLISPFFLLDRNGDRSRDGHRDRERMDDHPIVNLTFFLCIYALVVLISASIFLSDRDGDRSRDGHRDGDKDI